MPVECPHGHTLDWGDFGPDPDDGSVGAERCDTCGALIREVVAEVMSRLDAITVDGYQHRSDDPDVQGHAVHCAAWNEGQWCCLDRIPDGDDHWRFRDWLERTLLDVFNGAGG